jgi:hypothetical protein
MNHKNPHWIWRIGRTLLCLVVGLAIPLGYMAWKMFISPQEAALGFQPLAMAIAQYTSKDVIGDLGGMKVRIPRHYAEYVEYDGDPGWGEKRKGAVPERTFESKLSSFGIDFRFPDMKGLENEELRADKRRQALKQDNPWVSIGINAGEIYPSLGVNSVDALSRAVTKSITSPTQFWIENYERLADFQGGLEYYVVTGIDPNSKRPAKDNERLRDVYIHRTSPDFSDTVIYCGKTSTPGGVATCQMNLTLEPKAKVYLKIHFMRPLLFQWQNIRQSALNLILSFDIKNTLLNKSQHQN